MQLNKQNTSHLLYSQITHYSQIAVPLGGAPHPRLSPRANVAVMGTQVAQALFLLSTVKPEHIGSYAQMVVYSEESLSPGVTPIIMTFL